MIKEQKELWESIRDFPLDDTESEFPFSKRLAQDNNWTQNMLSE